MQDDYHFIPETTREALRSDLPVGLRALAAALDARELDAKFIGAYAASERYDDGLHLRIVLELAASDTQTTDTDHGQH